MHGNLLQAQGNAAYKIGRPLCAAVDMLNGNGDRGLAVIGGLAGEHLIHYNTQRVQVAAVVDSAALGLLGRDVVDRAQRLTGQGILGRADAGNAKISDLDAAVLEDHNIMGLNVPMDDATVMGMIQRTGDLHGEMQSLPPVEAGLLLKVLLQGDSFDELHDDKVCICRTGHIVNADDVGVGQHGDRLRLRVEATVEFLVLGELVLQHLHRYQTVQAMIQRLIYHRHTADADHLHDLIAVIQ